MDWIEEHELLNLAKKSSKCLKHILKDNLKIDKEKVLIIGDKGYPNKMLAAVFAGGYYIAAKQLGIKCEIVLQEPKLKGDSMESDAADALAGLKDGSILALSLSNKLGSSKIIDKSYRKFVHKHDHRFVSTPSLGNLNNDEFEHVIDAIDIDYPLLQDKAKKMKNALDFGKEIVVKTAKGTDLRLDVKGRTAITNDGDYSRTPGGGNIPAGEVYVAPCKNVNGVVVIDGTVKHHWGTVKVKDPVKMVIEDGSVVDIEGGFEADLLRKSIEWGGRHAKHPALVSRIGELGIGINPGASLIGATIVDEKSVGTAHIALGSNYWFGGTIYTIMHLDQIFKNPTIYVDEKKLMV